MPAATRPTNGSASWPTGSAVELRLALFEEGADTLVEVRPRRTARKGLGLQLQLGVDRKKKQAYAGLFEKSDTGMVAGKMSDVGFQLGETTFTGKATQYNKNGVQGGYVYFNNLNFAYERLCCTNPVRDSSRESSVIAGTHEQTDTHDLQDQELAGLQ